MRFFGSSKKDAKKNERSDSTESRIDAVSSKSSQLRLPGNAANVQKQQQQQRLSSTSLRKQDVGVQPITLKEAANTKTSRVKGGGGGVAMMASASAKQQQTTRGGGKAAPPSILHKKQQQEQQQQQQQYYSGQPPAPAPTSNPIQLMNNGGANNPRVRFMSSGESVASSIDASQVHLMAGGPGSVASSSAMSSVPGENVFDRVLHAVMAEENQRLNAMGMVATDPYHHERKLSYGDDAPINFDNTMARGSLHSSAGAVAGFDLDDNKNNNNKHTGKGGTKSAAAYAADMKPRARGKQVSSNRKKGSSSSSNKRQIRVDDLAEF